MSEGTLVIKKVFNCSPEKVFEAWTDPELVKKWYGPEGFTNEIHEMDVREGGKYHLTMKSPDGNSHPLRGMFKTIDSPHKLVLTWQWEQSGGMEGMDAETLITVEFKGVDGKTEMTMTHELPNKASRDNHEKGWSSSFNKLEKVVS